MTRPLALAALLLVAGCAAEPPPPATAVARPVPPGQWERAPTSSLPDASQRLQYMGQGRFGVMGGAGGNQGMTLPGRSGPGLQQNLRVRDVTTVQPSQ